jgi:hypothetical protein
VRLYFLLLLLLIPCSAAGEEQIDLRQKLLKEAPKAWSDYICAASHTMGEISSPAGAATEFKVNGLMGLYVRSDGRLEGENDRYNFVLAPKDGGGWELHHFELNKGAGKKRVDLRGSVTYGKSDTIGWTPSQIAIARPCAGLLIQATWLPSMFVAPKFKLTDVTWADEQKGLVRMDFEYVPANTANNPVRDGYVVLDPSRFWMIQECEVAGCEVHPSDHSEYRFRIQTHNEFDDSIEDFPYVSHQVFKILGMPGYESENDSWIKVKKMEESDVKPFSLETHGIAVPEETRMFKHYP